MNDDELIKRVVQMIEDLRSLGGSDRLYIFSPFFKPVNIEMPTMFGAVFNFPNFNDFSEDKINGFKAIVNQNSDILSGYVRIGDQVYKPEEAHEYKALSPGKGKELMKALVSRAVKVGRFDLSMLNPGWLKNSEGHNQVDPDPEHTMKEAVWTLDGDADKDITADNANDAIVKGLDMLKEVFGPFTYQEMAVQEMEEMLEDYPAPYFIELTASKEGVQIVSEDGQGIILYNNEGELDWRF